MDSKTSVKLVSLFLVSSVSLLGYVSMSTFGQTTGTPGMVSIDSEIIIRQGNGVNYSFSDDATISKLEVKASSIELNDWLEVGAVTSSGYLTNVLYDYRSDYIKWGSDSTDSSAVVTFTLSGLESGRMYRLYIDGNQEALLTASGSGVISFTYSGPWSEHQFEIIPQYSVYPDVTAGAIAFLGIVVVLVLLMLLLMMYEKAKKFT